MRAVADDEGLSLQEAVDWGSGVTVLEMTPGYNSSTTVIRARSKRRVEWAQAGPLGAALCVSFSQRSRSCGSKLMARAEVRTLRG